LVAEKGGRGRQAVGALAHRVRDSVENLCVQVVHTACNTLTVWRILKESGQCLRKDLRGG
jgi:hypothetical protein